MDGSGFVECDNDGRVDTNMNEVGKGSSTFPRFPQSNRGKEMEVVFG